MTVGRQLLQNMLCILALLWEFTDYKVYLFPLGLVVPFLLLYIGLTLGVPLWGIIILRVIEIKLGGFIQFGHAWLFTIVMFMFASILTSAAHYIYFRFLDNGHIVDTYQEMINTVSQVEVAGAAVDTYNYKKQSICSTLTPADITFQILSLNVIFGSLMSYL